jgi:RNA polymerase sigma-70 factor (ECF subfamily)
MQTNRQEASTHVPSDADLLRRVALDDHHAFELIYDRHKRSAAALAHRVCGKDVGADDVLQDAFLAVWRGAAGYDESRGTARGWILGIVHHRAVDEVRRHKRTRGYDTILEGWEDKLVASTLTDAEAERRERGRAVRGALKRLPASQRKVLVLSHFRGLTHIEIATALRQPVGTVKGRIRLGHLKMREALDAAVV